ncbi:DHA2 family efflux MFS transporter permease subunit [Anaerovorax odorimutans]|uniref:DHA2 family efflux MFS transporter permease subunit n=1 Tax=Anaerovorax odorimutans TaxID=109327 RepID=UPI00041A348B|nr:DHA2 family efflux MFS transporter permease subunit [Anaerovorax odorimutans]
MTSSIPLNEQTKIPVLPLTIVVIGAFMAFLDSSIVNVALPHMMSVFGVSSSDMQWILIAYMLTTGIVIPTSAFLCERFGHRRIYISSLLIFTVGSALCGISWSLNIMIAARIIQAIGGGLIIPVSMAIVYSLAPREKMGTAMGIWGLAAIMGPSVGPTLGGYLLDTLSWEWIFFVNLPIGLLAILLCPFYLKETTINKEIKFDLLGTLLIAIACFSLLLALSKGTEWGWKSQSIISLLIICLFTLAAFVVWESSISNPLIDIRVFKNKVVISSILSMSLLTMAMLGVIFIVPLYSENLLGYSPLKTGIIMMPMAMVSAFLMPVSGKIYDKYGAFCIGIIGVIIAIITTYNLKNLSLNTSYSNLQIMLVVRSLGFGLALMPISNAAMGAVPKSLASTASAVVNTVRQIASSLGIAIMNYVIMVKQAYHQNILQDLINYDSFPACQMIKQLQSLLISTGIDNTSSKTQALSLINVLITRQGAMDSIIDSMMILVVILIIAMPFVFLLTPKQVKGARLRQQKQIRQ